MSNGNWKEILKNQGSAMGTLLDNWGDTRIDPYLIWAGATDFAYLDTDAYRDGSVKWFPIIIELKGTEGWRIAAEFAENTAPYKTWIKVPEVYRNPASYLKETTFLTARVTKQFLYEFNEKDVLKESVKRFELGLSVKLQRGSTTATDKTDLVGLAGLAGSAGVSAGPAAAGGSENPIVAVIDDGLAFLHQRFRSADGGTRIQYVWDQDNPANENWRQVPELGYGRELTKQEIDKLIGATGDETAIYRSVGHEGVSQRLAHGTHVLDVACGEDPDNISAGAKAPTPIFYVQVQVPDPRVRDTSGLWLAVRVLDGLRYILDRADEFRQSRQEPGLRPIVVNVSNGNVAGPHDGSLMLERAIDELIRLRTDGKQDLLAVVIAAGNHHLERCHARFSLSYDESRELSWRILPDDATPSFLEIWLPSYQAKDGRPAISIEVEPPWGRAHKSNPISEGQCWNWNSADGIPLCTVVYLAPERVATGDRGMVLIALAPTSSAYRTDHVAAPCGIWKITVKNMNTAVPIDIDAWIQRDETPYGYRRRGRQSRFEDPDYVRFDAYGYPLEEDPENHKSYIRRSGTLNAIATGAATVAVAGYRYSDGLPATYSASGPEATDSAKLNSGFRRSPDAMAVSDDSVTCRGVLAAGTRSGSVAAMNGTSVAAAYVTRLLAEKEIPVDAAGLEAATRKSFRQRVHDYADQQDSPNPLSELSSAPQTINRQQRKRPKLPEQRAGGGRLEVQKKTLVKKDLRIGHRKK